MDRLLYRGCTPGNDVTLLQNDMNVISHHPQQGSAFAPLEVDGIFGAKSQSRVLEFQRFNSLGMDGIVGPQTRAAMEAIFRSEPGLQAQRVQGGVSQPGDAGWKSEEAAKKSQAYGKTPPHQRGKEMGGVESGEARGGVWKKGGRFGKY